MSDRPSTDEQAPAFELRLRDSLGRLADEARVPPLPDLAATTGRPRPTTRAPELAMAAVVVVAVAAVGIGYTVRSGGEGATVSTADADSADSDAYVDTDGPAAITTPTTAHVPTTSTPPPTSPAGVPVDRDIVVDARLAERMGSWTVEVVHPDEMPPGTEQLAIRIGDRLVTGGAYIPGAVSGPSVDELDEDGTITLSVVAETADREPIAESEPVTIRPTDLDELMDLTTGRTSGPLRAPIDPDLVVDARLTTRMGVPFLQITEPERAPAGTEFWEVRIDDRTTSVSSAVPGSTLGIRVDHVEPGTTISVVLVARSPDMTAIAQSEPVALTLDG